MVKAAPYDFFCLSRDLSQRRIIERVLGQEGKVNWILVRPLSLHRYSEAHAVAEAARANAPNRYSGAAMSALKLWQLREAQMSIREVIASALERFLDTYFGTDGGQPLDLVWKIFCAFLGSICLLALTLVGYDFSFLEKGTDWGLYFAGVMTLVLAVIIGASIKGGGPLRFFLLGALLYSGLLLAASAGSFAVIDGLKSSSEKICIIKDNKTMCGRLTGGQPCIMSQDGNTVCGKIKQQPQ